MSLDLFAEKGVSRERQSFTWGDLMPEPIGKLGKLGIDAFTHVRDILRQFLLGPVQYPTQRDSMRQVAVGSGAFSG